MDPGIVTLHGTVATSAENHLAARYAQDVRGVESVVNAIVVNPARQPLGWATNSNLMMYGTAKGCAGNAAPVMSNDQVSRH
jgi:hypothetical protein